ncbi:hypothetical protein MUK42_14702 [Musa troglodytarum]|uniref:Uncharacterized protein n=1 Tax=Musa troglodytarum TaxID=320322 RepID=A0A9E7LB49_9LILI|nr:hypothetical protein MUK42_14702 [Musa troglodytarum]
MVPQPWKEKKGKRAPNPTLGPAILLPSIYLCVWRHPQGIDTDTPTRLSSPPSCPPRPATSLLHLQPLPVSSVPCPSS